MRIEIGDILDGYHVTNIVKDPFVQGQINIFTDDIEVNNFGDRSPKVYRVFKSNIMSEKEHRDVINALSLKLIGNYIDDNEGNLVKVVELKVDYRKDSQHMNRVVCEDGNVYFLSEIKHVYNKKEIEK